MGNAGSRGFVRILKDSSSNILGPNKGKLVDKSEKELEEQLRSATQNTKIYRLHELLRATDNFSLKNKIGEGGFGNMYKGILPDGTLIAIKVMSGGSAQGKGEFLNEVTMLARLEHVNLVKLFGCCIVDNRRILVYNYLENGDLARALLDRGTSGLNFPWDARRRICIGVANGLAFLHDANIVHRDIKATNVLLDDKLNPKISDFGNARFLPPDMSHVTEQVVGTFGYMAPEYALYGQLTIKVDTYSFGILMLEIISGRRNTNRAALAERKFLLDRARDMYKGKELLGLVDKSMMGDFDKEEIYKYLIICLLCTQEDPDLRPDMSTLIGMLTDKIDVIGENLLRPSFLSQSTSPRPDEGGKHDFESNISSSPGSIGPDFLPFSGSPRKHEKDGSQSSIYSKEVEISYPESTASLLTVFTHKKIKKITENFKRSISMGHRKIYLGFVSNDLKMGPERLPVAVKIYDGDTFYQDENNWLVQVNLFKTLSHPNLVQLIGYCYEAKHQTLVYGYMAHGSLGDKLFSREQSPLPWDIRMKIAIDAARGLTYLHENERPVIHRNIKPSKILLDTVYNAKIFGFGTAIARPDGYASEISDVVVGTVGYIAPEYFCTGRVSSKSDVYSFGVVLVELLSGRNWKDLLSEEPTGLVKWTLKLLEEGKNVHRLMDARLKGDYPIQGAREVAKLAHQCLDEKPQQRPSMREIVESLGRLMEPDTFGHIADVELVIAEKVRKFERGSGSTSQSQAMNLETQLEDQGTILMRVGSGLTEAPHSEEWLRAKEIYLMQSQVAELPERPRCPKLKALYLHRNYKLRTIPISFFKCMPALQVLNLSRTRIKTLPDSLFGLCCLKRLFVNHCELLTVLCPKIGELKQLEVLDLHGTEIMDLPKEVVSLSNLRCLELSFCGHFNSGRDESKSNMLIPGGTICAFSLLEELSIDVDPEDGRWEKAVKAILDDIRGLRMLNTLKLYFPYVEHLVNFNWYSMPIEHFKFTVGHHANRIMARFPQDLEHELEQWDRCLKYVNGVGIPFGVKKVLHLSTAFFLDRHTTATELSKFGIENMQQLKCCILGECNEVSYLLDGFDFPEKVGSSEIVSEYSSDGHILGSLEYLHIYYMRSLRGIYTGPYQKCLCNLKSLTLKTCPLLAIIFTPDLLSDLSNLEELTVEDCEVVTSLVTCHDSAIHGSSCFLPKLKRMSLHYLPQLVSISHGLHIAPELELVNLQDCPNLSLSMEGVGSKHLTKIKEQTSLSFSSMSSSEAKQSRSSGGKSIEVEAKNRSLKPYQKRTKERKKLNIKLPPLSEGKYVEVKSGENIAASPLRKRSSGNGGEDIRLPDPVASPAPVGRVITPSLRVYTLRELKSATRNFRPDTMLGEGSFGRVFKGWVDEQTFAPANVGVGIPVAIKKSNLDSGQGLQEWQSEVKFLAKFSHPNLVKLIGYCWEDRQFLLVYEYVQRGSLKNHLFRRSPELLSWDTRIKIAIGAARGLDYLHTLEMSAIFQDFKPSDILLDGDYNAKLKLTKLGPAKGNSHVTTRVMGMNVYAAPEYVATGHLYMKSSVYGFGVMLLEMLTSQEALDMNRPFGEQNLVEWARPSLSDKKLTKIMDRGFDGQYPIKGATQVAKLILKCLEVDPRNRPSMDEILATLEAVSSIREKPKELTSSSSSSSSLHRWSPFHYHRGVAVQAKVEVVGPEHSINAHCDVSVRVPDSSIS